jgi:indolepyruvate ferredoxin oxidoreductase beta subunit
MSQRGGAVVAELRISADVIHSDLVPGGAADLLVGLEPVEALRYTDRLRPGGTLITAADPLENIPDYPDLDAVRAAVAGIPGSVLVEASALAKEAGSPRSANIVMAGAASVLLPIDPDTVAGCIADFFASKGDRVVETNLRAFASGRAAAAPVG